MRKVFCTGMLFCLGVALQIPAAAQKFQSDWDHRWQTLTEPSCTLQLPVAEYGLASFSGRGDQALNFTLQSRRDLQQVPLSVLRHAPPWHPQPEAQATAVGGLQHVPGAGVTVTGAVAEGMLWALRDGYDLEIKSPARALPYPVSLRLRSLGFGPALDAFLDCARSPVQVSWLSMSRTRVSFATDSAKLSAEDQLRLTTVINYVQADPSISHVYVDGHTDASGVEKNNVRLSKRRAEAVAKVLQTALTDRVVVVRYHGQRYPVADNVSSAGKAQNRRTTIRLSREPEPQLADSGG
ncbi:MAG: OmpA family protein [Pseudomonadota bacterium]